MRSFARTGTLSGNFPRILLFQAIVYLIRQTKYFATLFLSYALLKMQFFFLDSAHWNSRSNKLKILRQQFSYGNDVLSYFFKRFALIRLCSLNKRKSIAVALILYLYKNFRHFQSFENEIFN